MRRTHPVNMFVCECITQSLFRLMKRKPYNKITVTDLVQEAGVSRNSFYRNYQSTEEIIRQFLEEKLLSGGTNLLLIQTVILTLFLKCSITF
ncbi:MAG TPA: TetR/AcrR family transcriptional regulator [Candidatus Scybalocola faecigallinarum]|uniref:TetR/AcrR family transcriptional regulator n=1 Tax=Candidatus Scybalocola faecigallinarum TaxID=2840941 RepID=A0A9D1F5E0_9FIRM|nr:TetR/AcrR family transcriptional regulator [Candidatus Scybalocola faecigallinarum]